MSLQAREFRHWGFIILSSLGISSFVIPLVPAATHGDELQRIRYNNPGLVVDLSVGLWSWPLPMDFDEDGDHDLLVVCPDKPYNGTYFFENTSGDEKLPVFKPGKRISKGLQNVQVSYIDGQPRVLSPGKEHAEFFSVGLDTSTKLGPAVKIGQSGKTRANQWKHVDYDGDGKLDLIVGMGHWTEYGWDDAYNDKGEWTNGPLHGYVYLLRNTGTTAKPTYDDPIQITSGGEPIDVFGWPSPSFADFDDDGDLDLMCGEFLDKFTYFENTGSRKKPAYAAGRRLTHNDKPIAMDLQMIVPVAFDWDKDGDFDLIVGDEDGRVGLVEHSGKVINGLPQYLPPVYFQQEAADVAFGALATPDGFDWDNDGDDDLICGNTAGYIALIENLGGMPPKWAAPKKLKADGETIRIQAGPNGSIQGPCEAKWGYTTQTVGDWDHDGLPDIIANSIWGKIVWYRNVGTREKPELAAKRPIEVAWNGTPPKPAWNWWNPEGNALVSQWRTTPVVVDFNGDKLNDLVMLDHEGYLAFFERNHIGEKLQLQPGQRIFVDTAGKTIQLNGSRAGGSGRRKLAVVDWDGDGRSDVLVNSTSATWLRNVETRDGKVVLEDKGQLSERNISGHTSSPTTVDWNKDGVPDLLVGAEDGFLYYMTNPRTKEGNR
ncbi:MAG: hypothetical protein CMJ64_02635 [Planctomycetaceae bacterium]|nr:hypothetical protein [Planctomycetaceae bacterium]